MTPKELWEHYLSDAEEIEEDTTDVDDHGGANITLVLKLPDGRYSQVHYHSSRGGDWTSWRAGDLSQSDIQEVKPVKKIVTVTKWVPV